MIVINADRSDWRAALTNRIAPPEEGLSRTVAAIIADVRERGDIALLESARKFDSPHVRSLKVSDQELESSTLPPEQAQAMQTAYGRVIAFHQTQREAFCSGLRPLGANSWSWKMGAEDVGQRIRPLHSAGLYVPGGNANYPSSVLMLSGPANAAGVKNLVVTSPAGANGNLSPGVLFALRTAGIRHAVKIGGASAVAALAFGTESVPRVDKILGPGNKYVNEAKRQLWGSVGVDGLYGPSEVCVVVDSTSNSAFAAADLLAQLEHASDNLGFIISIGDEAFQAVALQIEAQVSVAPRANILRECLQNVRAFVTENRALVADIVNEIAPEHLSLCLNDPSDLVDDIENAGCILVGDWTPESAADFCLGPSHTLPTNAAARFAGPVNVMDFLKIQSVANLDRSQLEALVPVVKAMSEAEGFPAHGFATEVRFQS